MEKEELKTLKDIKEYRDADGHKHLRAVDVEELRAEAVKWVKEELSFPHGQRRQTKRWMKRLNLTEEDLK